MSFWEFLPWLILVVWIILVPFMWIGLRYIQDLQRGGDHISIRKRWSNVPVKIHGERNPAICALDYLIMFSETLPERLEIDEQSFKDVAEDCKDHEGEGFLVSSAKDLDKLCRIGHFSIRVDKGKTIWCSRNSEEWKEYIARKYR